MAILWSSTANKISQLALGSFDMLLWCGGPLFIVLAVVLIGGCGFLYFTAILPYVFPEQTPLSILNLIISVWIVVNMAFNYFTCVFTPPGSPTPVTVGNILLVSDSIPG